MNDQVENSSSPAAAAPGPNLPEYSVSELAFALKRSVEENFGYVRVRGEISGLARPRSGHVYFALKDDKSVLNGVCWRGVAQRLSFKPEDGLEVVCSGKLSTYPARSKYQLIVEQMEPAGIGALLAQLEERRKRLAAEGLFDDARKQALPYLPDVIGVVTSPSGAVIRDILHRLADRFPRRVLVWPVLVQGPDAAEQVARAVAGFNGLTPNSALPRPDLLIVARGGGSVEDLWAFNEEAVVRAVAASDIPVISAVGHETDTTLIDFVSDRRAPTPSAAAEMAVPVRAELAAGLDELARRGRAGLQRLLAERRRDLEALERGLRGPRDLLALAEQRLDDVAGRLARGLMTLKERRQGELAALTAALQPKLLRREIERQSELVQRLSRQASAAFRHRLADLERRLEGAVKLLDSLSYQNVLARGFALVRDASDTPVTHAAMTQPGQALRLVFQDGDARATVDGAPRPPKAPAKRRPRKADDDDQGSLL